MRHSGALLFVNSETGAGATAVLDSAGNYRFVGPLSSFSSWTHITGTPSGGVLFVNSETGVGATAVLDDGGNYRFVGSLSGFSSWTHIAGI
jgi:hypothetical protein